MEFDFKAQPEAIQKFIILGAVLLYHNLVHEYPSTSSIMAKAVDIMEDANIHQNTIAKLLNNTMLEFDLLPPADVGEAEAGRTHNDLNSTPPDKGAVKPYLN